jgi:hypothetical protein
MSQMEPNQPIHEQASTTYGAYEGNRGPFQQQYEVPYQQSSQSSTLDDNFVEAVAQRIAQYTNRATTEKVREKSERLSAGQRTALAIISIIFSVLALIPLGIVLGQQGMGGLIALGIVCCTIFLVNAVVHGVLSASK